MGSRGRRPELAGAEGVNVPALLRDRDLDVPLVLSSTIGPDLKRLVPSVEQQLRDAERRRAQQGVVAKAVQFASHDAITLLPNRGC